MIIENLKPLVEKLEKRCDEIPSIKVAGLISTTSSATINNTGKA